MDKNAFTIHSLLQRNHSAYYRRGLVKLAPPIIQWLAGMRYRGCVQFFSAMVILLCLILVLLRIGRSLLHDNNIDNEYCTNDICYSDTMVNVIGQQPSLI